MPTYRCPVEDCDETAPTAGAIQGHVSGTAYGNHQGESGYAYEPEDLLVEDSADDSADETDAVDDDSASDSDPEQDSADAPAPEQPTETPTDGAETEASADGGSGIVPESDAHTPSTDSADDSAPECPGCGNDDLLDASEHLEEHRDRLEEQHVELLEANDHVCRSCGGVF